jgi:hypothetical protein
MGFWGISVLLIVAWLCGSACSVYKGESLQNQGQREQPASAPFVPRDLRDFERQKIPPTTITITRPDNANPPSADPPEPPESSEPPTAGKQAPSNDRAPEPEPDRREDTDTTDDDAGATLARSQTPAATDAGAPEPDAGTEQRIATGKPSDPDAGRPRRVAKASAACRGERGYEIDGRCYFVLDTPVSWNVGRDRCYEHDAHLASVTSELESDLIASFELDDDVWIGFSRFGAAHFSWLTNESTSFSNWKKGAPRAMQESGALILSSTGQWTNRPVPELHPPLCETENKATRR